MTQQKNNTNNIIIIVVCIIVAILIFTYSRKANGEELSIYGRAVSETEDLRRFVRYNHFNGSKVFPSVKLSGEKSVVKSPLKFNEIQFGIGASTSGIKIKMTQDDYDLTYDDCY